MAPPPPRPVCKSALGTASKISGANLYTRLNYWIVQTGGEALATPPSLVGVDAPAEADLDLSAYEAVHGAVTEAAPKVL